MNFNCVCLFLSACSDLSDSHLFIKVVSPYHQKSKFQLQHCKVLASSCHCCVGISRSSRSMKKRINNALNNGSLLLGNLFIL